MILKQNLGYLVGLGGKPGDIKDLSWSLYNFNSLYPDQKFRPLKDLGDPANFQYFFISEDKFIEGRSRCFEFNGESPETAKSNALNEFNNFMSENFIPKNHIVSVDLAELEC